MDKSKKIFSVVFLFIFGIFVVFFAIKGYVQPVMIFMFIVTLIIIVCMYAYKKMVIQNKYSTVAKVLKEYNSNINYIPEPKDIGEHVSVIKENKLISSATSYKFTDCIEGKLLDYNYKSYNLHATHVQSTGKSSTTVTDFKGKFYSVDIKEDIKNFIVKEERFKSVPKPYEFYELESIDFNKHLNLYCIDKVQIHSVFTPSVIKKYSELVLSDNCKTYVAYIEERFYLFFYDNQQNFSSLSLTKEDIIKQYEDQCKTLQSYLEIFFKKY